MSSFLNLLLFPPHVHKPEFVVGFLFFFLSCYWGLLLIFPYFLIFLPKLGCSYEHLSQQVAPLPVHVLAKKKKKKKILGHAGGRGLPWVWSLAWVVGVDRKQWGGGCWLRWVGLGDGCWLRRWSNYRGYNGREREKLWIHGPWGPATVINSELELQFELGSEFKYTPSYVFELGIGFILNLSYFFRMNSNLVY